MDNIHPHLSVFQCSNFSPVSKISKNFLWTCWNQGFWLQETESHSKVVKGPFVKEIVWIWERSWKEVLLASWTRSLPGITPCLSFCVCFFFCWKKKLYLPFLIFSLHVGISFCFSMRFVPNGIPITIKYMLPLYKNIRY